MPNICMGKPSISHIMVYLYDIIFFILVYDITNQGQYIDSVAIMISFKISRLKGSFIAKRNQKILL